MSLRLIGILIGLGIGSSSVCAQGVGNGGRATSSSGNGVLPLPAGIRSVVSDDALNQLLVVAQDDSSAPFRVAVIRPRHVYSGALAALFGGPVIPASSRVNSPGGFAGAGGFNQFGFGVGGSAGNRVGGGSSWPGFGSGAGGPGFGGFGSGRMTSGRLGRGLRGRP